MRDHLRTRDAIEHDAQLETNIRVVDRAEGSQSGRAAELTVADVQGAQLDCTVWERWPGTADWAVGHWYRLRRARGQVWDGDPELHVTPATTVQPLGCDIAARRATVLAIPDVHVGKQQGGHGSRTWPVDTAAGLEAAVDVAVAREVDAVVQLGDLVHNDKRGITAEDRAVVTGALDALAAAGIPFHYILGNHEREAGRALLAGHDGAHLLGVTPTMVGAAVALYGLDHTDAVPDTLALAAAPEAAVRVLCLHQSVAPLSSKAAPDVDASALLRGTDVRLDLLITGETHAHTTATVDGTHLVSAGATAPLKRGVEPSVELLQVGYGTVVCERIMLGETPG